MSDWQALFPTRAAAERYLATITDPAQRAATQQQLGLVDAVREAAPNTRPPAAPSQTAQNPASGQAMRTIDSARTLAITLLLPYPPTLNSIWRATVTRCRCTPRAQVRVLLSARGRQYRRATIQAHADQGAPRVPAGTRLALTIHVHGPDRRMRDLSNIPKAVEDALTHAGLWADDSLIDELHLYRHAPTPGGQIRLTVTPLPHA